MKLSPKLIAILRTTLLGLTAAATLLALFVFTENWRGDRAWVRRALFRSLAIAGAIGGVGALGFVLFANARLGPFALVDVGPETDNFPGLVG